ncbi:MAG: hypothetical protein ABIE94_02185 [archaeon]
MPGLDFRILSKFKKEPNRQFSTTNIVKDVFPEDYLKIKKLSKGSAFDKERIKEAKRHKGKLHRKLLYHLNKLVDEGILKVSKIQEQGEKCFELAVKEGEYVFEKNHKKITISKPALPATEIDGYEQKGIIKKYSPETWINRLNSIILDAQAFESLQHLYSVITELFHNINDVLCINDFELLLLKSKKEEIEKFLKKVDIDTLDYNKDVTFSLYFPHIKKEAPIIDFVRIFSEIRPVRMHAIFALNSIDLSKHHKIIEEATSHFSKHKLKLNIKNISLKEAPYAVGRSGVHTLDDEEWEIHKEESRGKTLGVSCVQSSVAIDIDRFFKNFETQADFRKFILKTAKSLLTANTLQRRNSLEYFRKINELNKENTTDFFRFSRNYIRLWNYDWQEKKQEHIISLLESCQEEIGDFCHQEETIFKSCGIPIRFKVVFSSTFAHFDQDFLSKRTYHKTTIRRIEDLHTDEMKNFIQTREKIFKIFEGGDRTRFFRSGDFTPEDITREINYILNSYELPFFCYDFTERKGNISLTNFM